MATKLLPAHLARRLPGVIGYSCHCGADDWSTVSIKSRPSPEGYVRLRCMECAREASTAETALKPHAYERRRLNYYSRVADSCNLKLRLWASILSASIDSGEFTHKKKLRELLTIVKTQLADAYTDDNVESYADFVASKIPLVRTWYLEYVQANYKGSLPWQDVVASAYSVLTTSGDPNSVFGAISYKGVWDPSTKRLRPFQTPSWMPKPATFTNHSH